MFKAIVLSLQLLVALSWQHPLHDDHNIDDDNDAAQSVAYLGEKVFGVPLSSTGEKLMNYNPDVDLANPEEMGEYAEGDILFPVTRKNGLVDKTYRWPNGVVPYEFALLSSLSFRNKIHKAMDEYHKKTCIRFRKKNDSDKDYVHIQNSSNGCWSSVGRIGGKQILNLQEPGCTTKIGTAIHELMHVLGFVHEHTRWERDDYVSINWKNIKKDLDSNFKKHEKKEVTGFDVGYDYASVMHYSKYAFSKNNKPTIEPKNSGANIGQRDGFSKGDIRKINAMYNTCSGTDKDNGLLSFLLHWT